MLIVFWFTAPGAYQPENVNLDQSISYSFGSKCAVSKPNDNPAPGTYAVEKCNVGGAAPAFSFGSRINHDKPNGTPAPGDYEINKIDHAQAYSFGIKTDLTKPNDTPAPNAYNASALDTHISYSFGVKPQEAGTFSSPGKYIYIF